MVHEGPHNSQFLVDRMVGGPLQILVSVGGFSVDIGGNHIVVSNHPYIYSIGRLLSSTCLFYGELDAIVLLIYVLKQLILILLLDDHSNVVYVSSPECWWMWGLGNGFLLKFFHEKNHKLQNH